MKKSWNLMTAIALAAALVLLLTPEAAADVRQTVDPEKDTGAITLTLKGASGAAADVEVTLYQVGKGAIVNGSLMFKLVDGLTDKAKDLNLNGITAQENVATAKALEAAIKELRQERPDDMVSSWRAKTDGEGVVTFRELPVGVYLTVQTTQNDVYQNFESFLMYLPMAGEEGSGWEFSETANPKLQRRSSGGGGGGGGGSDREPERPTVVVPDPEVPPAPVEPVEPVEPELPGPDVPVEQLPQTGMLQWPVPMLSLTGLVLFSCGWVMDKKGRKVRND